jgi:hypothetical protein
MRPETGTQAPGGVGATSGGNGSMWQVSRDCGGAEGIGVEAADGADEADGAADPAGGDDGFGANAAAWGRGGDGRGSPGGPALQAKAKALAINAIAGREVGAMNT